MASNPDDSDDYGISPGEVDDRRREDLLDHRAQVRERWMKIEEATRLGDVNSNQAPRLAYTVAEWFVADLAPLMRPQIGSEPPTRIDWWDREVGEFSLPNGKVYLVEDLQEFMNLDSPYVYEWTERVDDGLRGRKTKDFQETVEIPMSLSKNAIRMGEHFLADLGLEIDVTDNDGGASWDVDDYRG